MSSEDDARTACHQGLNVVRGDLRAATSEFEAERVGRGPLTELLHHHPECLSVVGDAGRDDPKLACALSYSSARPVLHRLLGREAIISARIRFAQPDVPGWWDGWSSRAIDRVLHDDTSEFVHLMGELIEASRDEEVLRELADLHLGEFIASIDDEDIDALERQVQQTPKLRRAIAHALTFHQPPTAHRERLGALARGGVSTSTS